MVAVVVQLCIVALMLLLFAHGCGYPRPKGGQRYVKNRPPTTVRDKIPLPPPQAK